MTRPFRSLFVWTLAVWLPLFAACYAAAQNYESESAWPFAVLGGLMFAAVCAPRALVIIRERHWAIRVVWWLVTSVALSSIAVCFAGQFEKWTSGSNWNLLTLAWLLPAAGLLFVWGHARYAGLRLPGFRWLADAAVALIFAVLLALSCWYGYDFHVSRLEREADARWTQLGRPPEQFFATEAKPQTENASLAELRRDLAPLGFRSMYKNDLYASTETPGGVVDIISLRLPAGDDVNLGKTSSAFLDEHSETLVGIYARIISREPPRWAFEPKDGPVLRVPNFLMLRQLAQITTADALRRISLGDHAGAVSAIAAMQRINEGVHGNPILVSRMIHVAIEACTTRARCRLPAEPGEWKKLPGEIDRLREGIRCAMQIEGCILSDFARHASWEQLNPEGILAKDFCALPLPNFFRFKAARQWLRRESAVSSSGHAEVVRLSLQPGHFSVSDLGHAEIDAILKRFDSSTACNFSRSWQRTNVTAILNEQTEITRRARSWLDDASADVPAKLSSHAIPGATWSIKLDREKRDLRLVLEGAPAWVTKSNVLGEGFYLMPLDGSGTWQFGPKAKSVAIQASR